MFKKTLSFLLYSNLFVSLCVVALAIRTALVLDLNVDFSFYLFLFFSTLFTYNFQRLIRFNNKEYSSKNVIWNKSNYNFSKTICLISFLISSTFIFSLNLNSLYLLFPLFIVSILYPLKLFSKLSLREVPFLKIFLISIVWTFATTLVVVSESNSPFSFELMPLLLDRFLFVMAITIPFDIRDLKLDQSFIKTIPLVFGLNGAKNIAFVCLFFSVVSVICQYYFLELDYHFLYSHVFTCLLTTLFVWYSDTSKKDFYFAFFIEGLSIFLLISYFLIP